MNDRLKVASMDITVMPDAIGAEFLHTLADGIEAALVNEQRDTDDTVSCVETPSMSRPVLVVGEVVDAVIDDEDHVRFRVARDADPVKVEVRGDAARRAVPWVAGGEGELVEVIGRWHRDGALLASAVLPVPRPAWALP